MLLVVRNSVTLSIYYTISGFRAAVAAKNRSAVLSKVKQCRPNLIVIYQNLPHYTNSEFKTPHYYLLADYFAKSLSKQTIQYACVSAVLYLCLMYFRLLCRDMCVDAIRQCTQCDGTQTSTRTRKCLNHLFFRTASTHLYLSDLPTSFRRYSTVLQNNKTGSVRNT